MTDKAKRDHSSDLRQQAEEKVIIEENINFENIETLSTPQIKAMIHELQVHQIELEMQNEELRDLEKVLDASRGRYFQLYDLAPVGYMTVTENGIITECNLTAAALLNVDRSVLVKKLLTTFIDRDSQDTYYLHRKKLFETQAPRTCELRMVKADSSLFWARLEASISREGSGEPFCRLVIIDVDEQKQAAKERERLNDSLNTMQKLESLGILAGGIAHDFNNLLGGVFGYIEMALEKTTENEVAIDLSKSLKNIDRARALTQQLLTFAKGGRPMKNIDNLSPLIRESTQFAISGSFVSNKIKIQEDLDNCNFDKNQISQVIDNLIINAMQAMSNGGTIEVSARNISLDSNNPLSLMAGKYVRISIKDQGIGIPKEFLSRIFDPYYSTKPTGHGLGLATCYSIINRHDGCIDVESEPGKGSTFHVYLPSCMTPVTAQVKKGGTKHEGHGRFLVMDDEDAIRDILKLILESFGYTVVLKENGEDAIDFFNTELKAGRMLTGMIFDLTIPGGLGGKDAIAEVRKIDSTVPVFVTSGYSEDPIMAAPDEYGFTASICKPFTKREFSDMLEKYMK